MPQPAQNKSNHIRFDPAFHFSLMPGSLLVFLWALVRAVRHPSGGTAIDAILALLIAGTIFLARVYSLRVQDRVIRLEERLRLSMLLPETLRVRMDEFTTAQLIALRFASDRELPTLASRAVSEGLTAAQIKDAIRDWRGDYLRV